MASNSKKSIIPKDDKIRQVLSAIQIVDVVSGDKSQKRRDMVTELKKLLAESLDSIEADNRETLKRKAGFMRYASKSGWDKLFKGRKTFYWMKEGVEKKASKGGERAATGTMLNKGQDLGGCDSRKLPVPTSNCIAGLDNFSPDDQDNLEAEAIITTPTSHAGEDVLGSTSNGPGRDLDVSKTKINQDHPSSPISKPPALRSSSQENRGKVP